jgi:hypothetical protein
MGVERKLFFLALLMGAAVFNLLHTFLGGILMFLLLYWFARWAKGLYVGTDDPYHPPADGKEYDWWTFAGVTKLLNDGAKECL